MLEGGQDTAYRRLLATNFSPAWRFEVWRQGVRVDTYGTAGLPVLSGAVSATLASKTTRQLSFEVGEDLYPEDVADLLAPYGNEIRAFAGVDGAGGKYMWPVFRGRIDSVQLSEAGSVQVECLDRAADVGDSYFRVPRNSDVGIRVVMNFQDLVLDAVPDAEFGDSSDFWEVVPRLTWENDRAAALDELAKGASGFWYALADGRFVLRRIPWLEMAEPVIEFTNDPGGIIQKWRRVLSRQGVANVVTAYGERSDGTPPVAATVMDTDPSSPTYVGGPFGVKGLMVQAQAATSNGQAHDVAAKTLRRTRALGETLWTASTPDASLELGDTATIRLTRRIKGQKRTRFFQQVVAAFTLPIVGGDLMSVTWRAQEL